MSKVISAGKAVLIGSFISKGISIFSSIILARLLMPEDYGALVLSIIIAGLITQIGSMGYELYFLQFKGNQEERWKILEQVYNLRLITNISLSAIQFFIGIFVYFYFEEKVSGGILLLFSFSLLIEGFNSPQETLLKDSFEFKKITIGNIIKESISTLGKVSGAFLGLGGFVFGIGPLMGSTVRFFYLKSIVPYKAVYFKWDKRFYKKPLSFGLHNLFGSVGMYLIQQTDKIFLTTFFSKASVGFYSFAWSNASMINNYLITPQGQVILTYITKHKPGDPSLFFKLTTLQRLFILFALPLLIIISGFIEPIIYYVFTEKWITAIPLVKILLVYFSINLVIGPFMSVLTGLGFPKINTNLVYARATLLIPSLFFIGFYNFDLDVYLIVFVSINILFEFMKVGFATTKMGLNYFDFIWKSKIDFVIVGIALYSVIFLEKFEVLFPLITIIIVALIDFKKTKESLAVAKKIFKK